MVAFGRVICGFKHLEKLNKMMLNTATEIPPFNINICDSGVVLNRPSTNQSRKSTSSNVSGVRSPKGGRNDPLQFGVSYQTFYIQTFIIKYPLVSLYFLQPEDAHN